MFNQHRIYRIFQLINFLKARPAKPIKSIMKYLDTSERTVYRYIDLLTELGFRVEKDGQYRLWIESDASALAVFTAQEADFLERLIHTSGKHSRLAESALRKIQQSSELNIGAENLFKAHLAQTVAIISKAMAEEKQLRIKDYTSAHSQTVSDRLVEPVAFTENYISLCAFEVRTKENKYFNIERMGSVEILTKRMKYQEAHKFHKPDIFGFMGKSLQKEIILKLNLRACLFLRENNPMSIPYIQQESPGAFVFHAQVQSFIAPAKFVLGMQQDVDVLGSEEFKRYLFKRLKNQLEE